MDDPRPDELLERCGRLAAKLGLAIAWTDALEGEAAKACTRTGAAAWKNAQPLSPDQEAAAAFFKTRARKRNPAVVASRSAKILLEADGGELDELCQRHGLPVLPPTLGARSRRGPHRWYLPPPGGKPLKIQLAPEGVTVSEDGYLVFAGALHPSGIVYQPESDDGATALATMPREFLDAALGKGRATRERMDEALANGGTIPQTERRDTLFHLALTRVRAGTPDAEIVEEVLRVNREQCRPPVAEPLVRQQVAGAITYAARHPTAEEMLRDTARDVLEARRAGEPTPTARASGGWDEPVPIATRDAVPEFELELLPAWLARWADSITAEKGAARDLGANLALGVVSGGLARHVQVSPRPGWYEPTNLYQIVALAPGQAKSPVFKAALRPVRTLERQRMRAWEENARLVAISGAIFEKRRKDLVSEAAGDDELDPDRLGSMMDELEAGLGPTEPEQPPRLLTEDVTPEGLASLLAAHGRIICASDEGSALFENLAGRYASGSASWDLFNKAHSAADVAIDRKSSGPVIVFDPALTLVLATQPDMLRTLAGKPGAGGRGVLARPLYALPASVHVDGATPQAEPDVLAEYERRVRDIYSDTPELELDEDDHPRPITLTFDIGARERFERFEREINTERRELSGDDVDSEAVYLGWLSKLAGQTARIAAVLHCAAKWTGGFGTNAIVIDEPTVDRAIVLARYYRLHARAVFGLMGELPMQALAVRILRWLSRQSEETLASLTVREIHRSRGQGTASVQVRVALRLLEEHGYVRVEKLPPGRGGGRPSERVLVSPRIQNHPESHDSGDRTSVLSPTSGDFGGFCDAHPDAPQWLARDQVWRCRECEPPSLPGEVLEERGP